MNTNILLVWNQFEEGIEYYLIPAGTEGIDDLASVHGEYVNSAEDKVVVGALNRINDRICTLKEHAFDKEIACSWIGFMLSHESPFDVPECLVVEAGFIP